MKRKLSTNRPSRPTMNVKNTDKNMTWNEKLFVHTGGTLKSYDLPCMNKNHLQCVQTMHHFMSNISIYNEEAKLYEKKEMMNACEPHVGNWDWEMMMNAYNFCLHFAQPT